MKKQLFNLTLTAALMCTLAGTTMMAQAPAAASATGLKMGVVNIQRAILESTEGKAAADKLQTQFSPKRTELQGKQAELEKLQKQLRDQEKTLSDDARAGLVRQIESKTKEFNRSTQDATDEFQQAEATVINEIGQKMMKVLDEFARKNGYQVIMDVSSPQSPVLWASNTVDVTDEIIKMYNAAHATPAAAASPAAAAPAAPAAKPPAASAPAAKKPGSK